jgi:hypothetical protein
MSVSSRCIYLWLLAAEVWLIFTQAASATIIQSANFNGHTYSLLQSASWLDSESEAQAMGGHLVVINNSAENRFVLDTFRGAVLEAAPESGKVNLWIGLSDQNLDGDLETCDNSIVSFQNFFTDQPQQNYSDEIYMGIRVRGENDDTRVGKWIDIVSNSRLGDLSYGVVEITPVPEPAACVMALMGLGCLAFGRFAGRTIVL